jgi:hypothetical protein
MQRGVSGRRDRASIIHVAKDLDLLKQSLKNVLPTSRSFYNTRIREYAWHSKEVMYTDNPAIRLTDSGSDISFDVLNPYATRIHA